MEFMVYRFVTTSDAAELAAFMDQGWRVERVKGVAAAAADVTKKVSKVRRRRLRRRAPNKITPELIKEMAGLRQKGMTYRIIGKRYGISDARAWQIVNKGGKA